MEAYRNIMQAQAAIRSLRGRIRKLSGIERNYEELQVTLERLVELRDSMVQEQALFTI